jgi:hypothetical protein
MNAFTFHIICVQCLYSYGIHFLPTHCLLSVLQTALCSTAIDNPNKLTKFDLVQHIVSYLDTDTVLFQSGVSFYF